MTQAVEPRISGRHVGTGEHLSYWFDTPVLTRRANGGFRFVFILGSRADR